ncbi:MAG TPA: hypothetical protein VK679_02915 [Gemmatimonadaceae bacterium]|nr:hypothetical protein [Gemmatimonadaceae bacterium]
MPARSVPKAAFSSCLAELAFALVIYVTLRARRRAAVDERLEEGMWRGLDLQQQ